MASAAPPNPDQEIGSSEALLSTVAGLAQVTLALFGTIQFLGDWIAGRQTVDARTVQLVALALGWVTAAFLLSALLLQLKLMVEYWRRGSKALPVLSCLVLCGLVLLFLTFVRLLYV